MDDRPKRSTRPAVPAPPPPSTNPRSQRPDLIQTAPELPGPRSHRAPPVSDPPPPSRQEVKTVPGGGMNRISDGRTAASAYVGVNQLKEGAKPLPATQSKVKLARDLMVENKEFRTEPALRSQSFPPPVPSRVTPVTQRRTWVTIRRGSPQAAMAVVALLAVTVGVLAVVAGGGRWALPTDAVVGSAAVADPAGEVQWDNGIDGQPGVLAPPLAPTDAPSGEAAGQPADVGPSARSAAPPQDSAAEKTSAQQRNASSPRPKAKKADESASVSSSADPKQPSTSRSTPPASSSQPERAPPQPWLE